MILPALLAALSSLPSARQSALAVWPCSWGAFPSDSRLAPAGLCRLDLPVIEAGFSSIPGSAGASLAGGLGLGGWAAGGTAAWSDLESGGDSLSMGLAAAHTLTGDPHGFIQGFFGPSICLGASLLLRDGPGEADPEITATGGFQFSVFPTFALGASWTSIPLSAEEGVETRFLYGGTYIFNRQLRAHVSYGDGSAQAGAELDVGGLLGVMTGTDGHAWCSGVSVDAGRFTIGYGLRLEDEAASHTVSVAVTPWGEETW